MISRTRVDIQSHRLIAIVTLLASAALFAMSGAARAAVVDASSAWVSATKSAASGTHAAPAPSPLCRADDQGPHRNVAHRTDTPLDARRSFAIAYSRSRNCAVSTDAPRVVSRIPARGYDATAPPA